MSKGKPIPILEFLKVFLMQLLRAIPTVYWADNQYIKYPNRYLRERMPHTALFEFASHVIRPSWTFAIFSSSLIFGLLVMFLGISNLAPIASNIIIFLWIGWGFIVFHFQVIEFGLDNVVRFVANIPFAILRRMYDFFLRNAIQAYQTAKKQNKQNN